LGAVLEGVEGGPGGGVRLAPDVNGLGEVGAVERGERLTGAGGATVDQGGQLLGGGALGPELGLAVALDRAPAGAGEPEPGAVPGVGEEHREAVHLGSRLPVERFGRQSLDLLLVLLAV